MGSAKQAILKAVESLDDNAPSEKVLETIGKVTRSMTSAKQTILQAVQSLDDNAQPEKVLETIAKVTPLMPPSEYLYAGGRRPLITFVGLCAIAIAIACFYAIPHSKEWAATIYMFWAIAPPSWFFIEWVWLFKSYGDAHRLNQFKTTIDIAQKFWGGVLALLALEILLIYGLKF